MKLPESELFVQSYGMCPMLFLEVYKIIIDKFCQKEEIDSNYHSSEHAFWAANWDKFKASTSKCGHTPKAYNYLYKFHKNAVKNGDDIHFETRYFDVYARYCNFPNFRALIESDRISNEARKAQYEYNQIQKIRSRVFDYDAATILEKYANTDWWLYFFGYDSRAKKSVVRLKFHIGYYYHQYYYVGIENSEDIRHPDYVGYIDTRYSTRHFAVCNLRTPDNQRFLHMKFNIGSVSLAEICLGHYSNYDDDNLISGTVIIQRVDQGFGDLDAKAFNDDNLHESGIPEAIQIYFSNEDQNFIRIPRGLFSLSALEEWHRKHLP